MIQGIRRWICNFPGTLGAWIKNYCWLNFKKDKAVLTSLWQFGRGYYQKNSYCIGTVHRSAWWKSYKRRTGIITSKKKKLKRCPATESSYYCNPRLASIGFNWYLNGALLKSRLVLLQEIPQLKSHRKNKILRFGTSSACDTLVQVKETMFLT